MTDQGHLTFIRFGKSFTRRDRTQGIQTTITEKQSGYNLQSATTSEYLNFKSVRMNPSHFSPATSITSQPRVSDDVVNQPNSIRAYESELVNEIGQGKILECFIWDSGQINI